LTLDATTSNATYLWQDNSINPTFNVTQPGAYWIQVTDSCGTTIDTINVNYNSLPTVDLSNDTTLCQGETLTLDATTSNAIYLWQDNSTNPTFTVTQQGTHWVEVTVNKCSTTDTINVSYNPLPTIDLGNDTTLCQGNTLTLDATTSNATYLWQDNSINPTFNVTQPGAYWVQVTDSCGTTTDTINVIYNPLPTVDLGNDTILCQGETLTLDATTPNASYLWQNNSTSPVYNVFSSGIYWVEVTDTNNCIIRDSININFNSIPKVNFNNDTTLCIGDTLILDVATDNAVYLWQDSSKNSSFTITNSGEFWVKVTNQCGSDSDTIKTLISDCECIIFLPNAFTPNNDNINDVFKPVYECELTDFRLMIFNRWGDLIYETNEIEVPWDGKANNGRDIAQNDVYVWILEYAIPFNGQAEKHFRIGHITLLK